ncbi:MAG: hypothetical protein K9G62_03455 [Alphaproteobacteria bacterium]|nr:hypothetical protein [Alphaproteobacteria bacterium]
MKTHYRLFILSTAFMALGAAFPARAETVTTNTVVTQKDVPNVIKTDFMAFDLNKDNILSMTEVGQKLFYIFDTDGNEVIDNIEFDNKKVMTIIPMEKSTFTFIDRDDDGQAEHGAFSYETFIEKSGLMRFDKNMDGLSPSDFIGRSFLELDTNHSKAIELPEWKKVYIESVLPPVAEQERYNP